MPNKRVHPPAATSRQHSDAIAKVIRDFRQIVDARGAIDPPSSFDDVLKQYREVMQFELPRNENSYVLTHDILRGPFRTRTADPRHRRERTIGSSVDQETHDVFSAIVKLFDRTPAAVLNQLIDSFILLARPYVIDLVETRNGAGAHESRMFSDERYRQIFEWESRYSASTRGGNENDAR